MCNFIVDNLDDWFDVKENEEGIKEGGNEEGINEREMRKETKQLQAN